MQKNREASSLELSAEVEIAGNTPGLVQSDKLDPVNILK
jgi:hypothetical protein